MFNDRTRGTYFPAGPANNTIFRNIIHGAPRILKYVTV